MRPSARLCWALDERPWVLLGADLAGGVLFVVGCLVFYFPAQYASGVTLFLAGSVLMLFAAAGRILLRYGPSS